MFPYTAKRVLTDLKGETVLSYQITFILISSEPSQVWSEEDVSAEEWPERYCIAASEDDGRWSHTKKCEELEKKQGNISLSSI